MLRLPLLVLVASVLQAAWNPDLATAYLESRQKIWMSWPRALQSGVPCISCHTGLPYLISQAARRRGAGPLSAYESALIEGARTKSTDAKVSPAFSVLAALVLGMDDARAGAFSPAAEKAFDRMWSAQLRDGPNRGAWAWISAGLDPWEEADSVFYGAALAALALGTTPADYQARPQVREKAGLLTAYLRDHVSAQPLHNRLALLWASTRLRDCLSDAERRNILRDLRQKQAADGGWTIASLGQFKTHTQAPPQPGSNSYATAIAAFTLVKAGVTAGDPALSRALEWLEAHQDRAGYWDAQSMNHRYEAGSVPLEFMRDAATGYAIAALTEARQSSGAD